MRPVFFHPFPLFSFDVDNREFFSPSMRSRIIEFILKRKRLSNDVSDEFAFGIDKGLTDGIYLAAYPLHDVSNTFALFLTLSAH